MFQNCHNSYNTYLLFDIVVDLVACCSCIHTFLFLNSLCNNLEIHSKISDRRQVVILLFDQTLKGVQRAACAVLNNMLYN